MKNVYFQRISFLKSFLLFSAFAFCFNAELKAQARLYGMTPKGGDIFGAIFSTDIHGRNLQAEHVFEGRAGAFPYYTKLCDGLNGKFYGLTSQGGQFDKGVLFSFDTATGEYVKLVDFDGPSLGAVPRGRLTLAGNGQLYGLCSQGGTNGEGSIFKYDIVNNSITKLFDFESNNSGKFPFSYLMEASNGSLYGMCYQGGAHNDGVLFEFNPDNDSFFKRIDFDGNVKGRNPYGSLVEGQNGELYGMSYQGGSSNFGTFFSYDPVNHQFDVKFNFNGSVLGSNPYGTPVLGPDGNLFALTYLGGANNFGTIIEYNPVSDTCYKHHDFTGSAGGRSPIGDLSWYDGAFYGMTPFGGNSNGGIIFSFDPSANTFSKVYDFAGTTHGAAPYGTLMVCEDKLYGCTYQGGISSSGVLFSFDPANSQYKKLCNLNSADEGSSPFGGLCKTRSNRYFGLSYSGGLAHAGVVFEFDPELSEFTAKQSFDGPVLGKNPYGTLCEGLDGRLYGFCYQGGQTDNGTLFCYDPESDTLILLHALDGLNTGRNPYGGLTLAPNGKLYGMTSFGGFDDYGVLLEYDPVLNTLVNKVDFTTSLGTIPFGSLTVGDSSTLYGCSNQGGKDDFGVLFRYKTDKNQYTVLHEFDGLLTGSYPQGKLLYVAEDNALYGMTQLGGTNYSGTLFKFNCSDSVFEKKKDMDTAVGANPSGHLILNSNGLILGTARNGGLKDLGVIFAYDRAADSMYLSSEFEGHNGESPAGELIVYCKPSRADLSMKSCGFLVSPSGKYVWNADGLYHDTIPATNGCDSIMRIQLKILDSSSVNIQRTACDSFVAADGSVLKSSGYHRIVVSNVNGCDSIIHLNLQLLSTFYDTTVNACSSYTAPDGKVYTSSGSIKAVIPNSASCDSIIRIQLNILQSRYDTSVRACRVYIAPDGKTYRSGGQYRAIVPNYAGCDSIIDIDLQIDTVDTRVIKNASTLTAMSLTGTFRWLNCLDDSYLVGEDSSLFTATVNGSYAVEVSEGKCIDTSDCFELKVTDIQSPQADSEFRVYPNPGTGNYTIDLGSALEEVNIELRDDLGRLILKQNCSGLRYVPLNIDQAAGVYSLVLFSGDSTRVILLMKQ